MLATSITSTTPITSDVKQTLLTWQTTSQRLSALQVYCPQYNEILASSAVEHSNTFCFIQAFLRNQELKQIQLNKYYGPQEKLLCENGSNVSLTSCYKYP